MFGMFGALRFLFPLNRYNDPIERIRAIGVYTFGMVALLATVALGIRELIKGQQATVTLPWLVSGVALCLAMLIGIILTRFKLQQIAARLLIVVWLLFGAVHLPDALLSSIFIYLIGLTLAALLLDVNDVLFVIAFSIGSLIFRAVVSPTSIPAEYSFVLLLGILVIESILAYVITRSIQTAIRQSRIANEQRVRLAEMNATIAQRLLTERLDLNTTLQQSAELIREALPSVHVSQIYMLDADQRQAMLAVSTDRNQRPGRTYGIASLNVIGRAALGSQPILIRNMVNDTTLRRTTFLDGMMSEVATPLHVGQRTIGVLDVQSRKVDAFSTNEIGLLKTLADQITLVLDNARLFAETREQSSENQRLLDQTRNQLREIERLNQQLTGGIWAEFLRAQDQVPAYSIDFTTGQVQPSAEWTRTMLEAARRNQLGIQQADGVKTIALPISVRGQAIGAMEFELGPDQEISGEQLDLMKQVLERVGFAVENTRLFEETQYFAQREALVNEISTRLQSNTSVEAVLAAAAQSLADALRAPHVAIRLGTPEGSSDNGNGTNGNNGTNGHTAP